MGVAISMAVHLSCDQEDTFESPNDISRDLTITLPKGCARNCARVDPTQCNSSQDRSIERCEICGIPTQSSARWVRS